MAELKLYSMNFMTVILTGIGMQVKNSRMEMGIVNMMRGKFLLMKMRIFPENILVLTPNSLGV